MRLFGRSIGKGVRPWSPMTRVGGYFDHGEPIIMGVTVAKAIDKVQLLYALRYLHDLRDIDTDYVVVNALVHLYRRPDLITVQEPVCDLPTEGWICTVAPGHLGPCAAWCLDDAKG
jgi:hypothetical protein